MYQIITFIRRFSLTDYYPVALGLFLVTFLIDRQSGSTHLAAIPGLLFLAYLPGYYLVKLVSLPINNWHWYGRTALYFTSSIAIVGIVQYLAKSTVPFTPLSQTALLLLLNTVLYGLTKVFAVPGSSVANVPKRIWSHLSRVALFDYLVLFIPLFIYGITIYINPTVDNTDNYLQLFQTAVTKQEYPFGYVRSVFFIPTLSIYQYITHLSPITVFKLIVSLSFYSSLFMAFDYIQRNIKLHQLGRLAYLAFLIPPVILVEANIVRPQLFIMAFTIPILLLLIEGLKSGGYRFILYALGLSVISTGYHELGAVFVALSFLALLPPVRVSLLVKKEFRPTIKQVILALIIIFPYVQLFDPFSLFRPIGRMIMYVFSFLDRINWQWWFIDNYTTIDGYSIGWPGIQALYYYLYNGLLLIGVMLILSLMLFKFGVKRFKSNRSWLLLLPLTYVVFYAVFAEVLPRIGLFFLPNRAWPHIMLGLVVCLILLVEYHQQLLVKFSKSLTVLFVLALIPGILATFYLTYNRVGLVFPEEIKAAKFIDNQLPKNSLLISTQPNFDLVRFYGQRDYAQTPKDYPKIIRDSEHFKNANQKYIAELTTTPPPVIVPDEYVITRRFVGDVLAEEQKKVLQEAHIVSASPRVEPNRPIYFIYSFRKVSGLNAMREYNKPLIDFDNANFFRNLSPGQYIYRDESTVIIQIHPK